MSQTIMEYILKLNEKRYTRLQAYNWEYLSE